MPLLKRSTSAAGDISRPCEEHHAALTADYASYQHYSTVRIATIIADYFRFKFQPGDVASPLLPSPA